ncbi:MAG: glycosyltransferase family 2 protein, partial [Bacteroidaceae bacterium]|nr:glycosyltransferase family 2 protein [Bacteroidaceae bacterium]
MKQLHIITPVKDAIDSTLETVRAVLGSELCVPHTYTVYNDFSTPENTARLQAASEHDGFRLVNLSELTTHPSPNYLLVLKREREACLAEDAGLLIVESDVTVRPDTLQGLWDGALARPDTGIAASPTVDTEGQTNYPYQFVAGQTGVLNTRHHCSFCCSLLTPELLRRVDFAELDETKNWFDVTISHRSVEAGLHNYVFTSLPVVHRPHSSRPWKQL